MELKREQKSDKNEFFKKSADMRFDCAGASGSRVGPSQKPQKTEEKAAKKTTLFWMSFFNEKVLKRTSKGRPLGAGVGAENHEK